MDNDFSYDRSAQDVINRVEEYGPVGWEKLFSKNVLAVEPGNLSGGAVCFWRRCCRLE